MNIDFLPKKILSSIKLINQNLLYEIRLRKDYPIKIDYKGEKQFLLDESAKQIICLHQDIESIISNVTESSIYAFNDRIKQGYLTTKDGVRIGLAGEFVVDNDKIITIKNIKSINIRLPHEVFGCSDYIYNNLFATNIYNTLIVGAPFTGKTTILKDLVRRLNNESNLDILVLDERGEFYSTTGACVDKISFCNKNDCFNIGVRALSPDVVIMDELSSIKDFSNIDYATSCGVKIIATIHADNEKDLIKKPYFNNNIFERYVFIKKDKQKGVVDKILDNNFNEL